MVVIAPVVPFLHHFCIAVWSFKLILVLNEQTKPQNYNIGISVSPLSTQLDHWLWLSLSRYLSWWIISSREYHAPSNQCFGTDIALKICLCFKLTVHVNRDIIIKPKSYMTLADFGYHVQEFWFRCSQRLPDLSTKSISVEGHSINALCALNYISPFSWAKTSWLAVSITCLTFLHVVCRFNTLTQQIQIKYKTVILHLIKK